MSVRVFPRLERMTSPRNGDRELLTRTSTANKLLQQFYYDPAVNAADEMEAFLSAIAAGKVGVGRFDWWWWSFGKRSGALLGLFFV